MTDTQGNQPGHGFNEKDQLILDGDLRELREAIDRRAAESAAVTGLMDYVYFTLVAKVPGDGEDDDEDNGELG